MSDLFSFDATKAARRADPMPSKVAAEAAESFVHQHHRKILDFLDGIHPRAAHKDDISAATGLDAVAVARRMIEIERARRVERAGYGKLSTGRPATLWRAKA